MPREADLKTRSRFFGNCVVCIARASIYHHVLGTPCHIAHSSGIPVSRPRVADHLEDTLIT